MGNLVSRRVGVNATFVEFQSNCEILLYKLMPHHLGSILEVELREHRGRHTIDLAGQGSMEKTFRNVVL